MKELQERIEECLARLKGLPALIRAEREAMNGKAAIEELKTRLKEMWLGLLSDADDIVDVKTKKKVYTNKEARESWALNNIKFNEEYQQVAEEIKRFEHQRNTATMNHESLVKEHSGLISTVDVLETMLKIRSSEITARNEKLAEIDECNFVIKTATIKRQMIVDRWARPGKLDDKEQEASNEGG